MNLLKKHLICTLLIVAASAASFSYALSYAAARSRAQNYDYYRSPKELAADGVELVTLTWDQEESLHRIIRTYYATELKKTFREETEYILGGRSPHAGEEDSEYSKAFDKRLMQQLEAIDAAAVTTSPAYSRPRKYQGLDGILGMFSSASLYNEKVGHFGGEGRLFFFRIDGEKFRLEKAVPSGEDSKFFESAPVERFKREAAQQIDSATPTPSVNR